MTVGLIDKHKIVLASKGRSNLPTGIEHHRSAAKLTEIEVKDIKIMLQKGYTQQVIANQFDVSRQQISRISTNKNWSHI